ncbi:MAG: hypothetical protein H5T99_06125 [Moorella sp. (in: Bacteria)]|nr:hypothetical protein [Moorella sp. (in: firmicutes)]
MIRELRPELREELRRLVEDRPSAVLDLGDRRVLVAVIETDREYDLDNDLADPVIAETVARGWEVSQYRGPGGNQVGKAPGTLN